MVIRVSSEFGRDLYSLLTNSYFSINLCVIFLEFCESSLTTHTFTWSNFDIVDGDVSDVLPVWEWRPKFTPPCLGHITSHHRGTDLVLGKVSWFLWCPHLRPNIIWTTFARAEGILTLVVATLPFFVEESLLEIGMHLQPKKYQKRKWWHCFVLRMMMF